MFSPFPFPPKWYRHSRKRRSQSKSTKMQIIWKPATPSNGRKNHELILMWPCFTHFYPKWNDFFCSLHHLGHSKRDFGIISMPTFMLFAIRKGHFKMKTCQNLSLDGVNNINCFIRRSSRRKWQPPLGGQPLG